MNQEPVFITGVGLEFPAIASLEELLAGPVRPGVHTADAARKKLGRGMAFKDDATCFALSAAQDALLDARLPITRSSQSAPDRIGVCTSSNSGNLDTVCKVAATIRASHVRNTSPLDLPNASSNIIGSSVALRFGCKGINLMLCGGGTSGIDAVHLAANAIRADRIDRAIVVGAEVHNDITARLFEQSVRSRYGDKAPVPNFASGAAAVLLEGRAAAERRGVAPQAIVGPYGATSIPGELGDLDGLIERMNAKAGLWLTPYGGYGPSAHAIDHAWSVWRSRPAERRDLGAVLGETYGALGILQCIVACLRFRSTDDPAVVATSGGFWGEGASSLGLLHPKGVA